MFLTNLNLLKLAQSSKREDDLNKENYRPVSILLHMSKVFERIMYYQINDYITDKLSKQLTGLRRNVEIWKKVLHKGGYIFAVFMDLS